MTKEFTISQSWPVPPGVTFIYVRGYGGGAGAAGAIGSNTPQRPGTGTPGGSGAKMLYAEPLPGNQGVASPVNHQIPIPVNPNDSLEITIGVGGLGGTHDCPGNPGSPTVIAGPRGTFIYTFPGAPVSGGGPLFNPGTPPSATGAGPNDNYGARGGQGGEGVGPHGTGIAPGGVGGRPGADAGSFGDYFDQSVLNGGDGASAPVPNSGAGGGGGGGGGDSGWPNFFQGQRQVYSYGGNGGNGADGWLQISY